MEKKIEDIKLISNVRTELGDLTELTASIKEKGVLEPLVVTKDNELIVGRRRLEAAKAAGLKTVPVHVVAYRKNEEAELQLIENIQRKDLDPIEEGEAFAAYIKKTGHGKEHLAKKIGKKVDYIERRLSLADLDLIAKKALKEKKIKLGHAVIMSRYPKKQHKTMLKSVEKGNYYSNCPMSVEDFADELDDNEAMNLFGAKFDKTDCASCSYNGGHQSLLTDTEGHLKDKCLNPSCFRKKQTEYTKARISELEGQNANVLDIADIKKIQGAKEVHAWSDNYKAAKKSIYSAKKKSGVYAVAVYEEHGEIKESLWRIASEDNKKPGKASEKTELQKKTKTADKLAEKIKLFKTELLRSAGTNKKLEGLQMKRFLVWGLYDQLEYNYGKEALKLLQEITSMTDKQLDDFILQHTKGVFFNTGGAILEELAAFVGVDLNSDFVLNEDYLRLYTKDQLVSLAAELKIPLGKITKNAQIKEIIIQGWKKGQVPRDISRRLN